MIDSAVKALEVAVGVVLRTGRKACVKKARFRTKTRADLMAKYAARYAHLWHARRGFFKNPPMVAMTIAGMGAAGFIIPSFADILLFIGITFFVIALTRVTSLPFKLPMSGHVKDYTHPIPGTTKPGTAGIYFFGNDRKTNDELWFNNDDMRTHVLIFGSTGSGKTEALASIVFNALDSRQWIYLC